MESKCKPGAQDLITQLSQKDPTFRPKRIFILDTNVIIHDANAFFAFKGVVIGIPFIVLEELDKFKREPGEKGLNACQAIRTLDGLRSKGCLSTGVIVNNQINSLLKVLPNPTTITFAATPSQDIHDVKDNLIIQTVQNLVKDGYQTTLVTKDINVRVKADALGLEAEDYTKGKISYETFYKGWTRLSMPGVDLNTITEKSISSIAGNQELHPNEFIILENEDKASHYRLFRFLGGGNFREVENIRLLNNFEAKNIQQLMALDLLMDDHIKLMTLLGPAGTGKTFLALLAGLYKVAYEHTYRKFLITRPVVALGADVGFLPGTLDEKLHYWMQPVHDNLEFIFSKMAHNTDEFYNLSGKSERGRKRDAQKQQHPQHPLSYHQQQREQQFAADEPHIVEQLQRKGIISLDAITYMRGRSIPFQFVLIDEVQNLTPHEVKTIVSRAGEGTKVVLAGDPYQIDSPYLDFTSNGLTVTTEKFKDHAIFGSVFLEVSERSELAKLAAEIL
jgi:PhoH-like ATPase